MGFLEIRGVIGVGSIEAIYRDFRSSAAETDTVH